ncbi:MAG: phosphate acyltransferase PlsX [Coriobacteriales bacterium]|nr:phosphate acyltransferase PlsX [Coriobacteriales bacterium]
MTDTRCVTVAVDAMGGDFAPSEILLGVERGLAADSALHVVLVGSADVVEAFAATHDRCEAVPTTQVIGMDEHPATAVRTKKDSSIVVGARLVKDGRAHAYFSAGSTGAAMAAATLIMGRIRGVQRPAIATVIPTAGAPVVLLDVGANADCKPEHIAQFAHMGAAYADTVLGVARPRISLLNIGEEPTKGSQLAQEAHALMTERVPGFVGNIEGRDVLAGHTDVIVTDGFTGNVALKLLEGSSKTLLGQVREVLTASLVTKLASLPLKGGLTALKNRLDPDTYGGAPLLGVDGVCIIGHGSSKAKAVSNALRVSAQAARGNLTDQIAAAVTDDRAQASTSA